MQEDRWLVHVLLEWIEPSLPVPPAALGLVCIVRAEAAEAEGAGEVEIIHHRFRGIAVNVCGRGQGRTATREAGDPARRMRPGI